MGLQVVHEQADLHIGVGSSQAGDVLLELGLVHRLLEDLIVLQAILLRDAGEQRQRRLVQVGLIDAHVLLRPPPLDLSDRLAGHHRLVDVVDLVPLVLVPREEPLHVDQPLPISFWVRVRRRLGPLEPLLLDAVLVGFMLHCQKGDFRLVLYFPIVLRVVCIYWFRYLFIVVA